MGRILPVASKRKCIRSNEYKNDIGREHVQEEPVRPTRGHKPQSKRVTVQLITEAKRQEVGRGGGVRRGRRSSTESCQTGCFNSGGGKLGGETYFGRSGQPRKTR